MRRPRKAAVLLGLLAVTGLAVWSGCGSLPDGWEGVSSPRVLVSFPPLYSFVKNVAGDQGGVICLCTDTGPHEYQFNANDTIRLKRADLFFANGLGLDNHFTDKLAAGTKLRSYRKLADALPPSLLRKGQEEDHDHDQDKKGHAHHHGPNDPHVWLGVPQAIAMVEAIRDDLKQVDGGHAGLYDKNAKAYTDRLRKLHQDGKERLKGLKDVPVITFHESMGYFADSFGMKILGAIEPQPGVDPAPKDIVNLVKKCESLPKAKKKLVLIAVEPQYRDTAARTLQTQIEDPKKTGVEKVVLVTVDPLETCNRDDLSAEWYVRMMEKNIESLADSAK